MITWEYSDNGGMSGRDEVALGPIWLISPGEFGWYLVPPGVEHDSDNYFFLGAYDLPMPWIVRLANKEIGLLSSSVLT